MRTFCTFVKRYPDYLAYDKEGREVRFHVSENGGVEFYGVNNKKASFGKTYTIRSFPDCPIMQSLVQVIMEPGSAIAQRYYQYTDSCASSYIIPVSYKEFLMYSSLRITVRQISKATNTVNIEKGLGKRFATNTDIISHYLTKAEEIKVRHELLKYLPLSPEEIDFLTNHDIFLRNEQLFTFFVNSKKFRNLSIKMIPLSITRVIGLGAMIDYLLEYAYNCAIAEMQIETGDFWTNYIKAESTANAIVEAKQDEIFQTAQTRYPIAYENERFIVIVPTTRQELIKEGAKLNNCLGTYEWNHYLASGKRQVVFIRRKKDEKRPYIACDIKQNGSIMQYLTYNNKPVSAEDAIAFKDEYQNYLFRIYSQGGRA